MNALAAERIKLMSVRSPFWCCAIVVVVGLAFAVLMGWAANSSVDGGRDVTDLHVADAVTGVSGIGVSVLMIMAALAVTSEYRFGTIKTTFQAIPRRSTVMVAKAAILALLSAVLTVVLAVIAVLIARAVAGSIAGQHLSLTADGAAQSVFGVPLYAALCVVLAVSVGALIRHSAGAIAIVLLWPLLIENLFGLFGTVGRNIEAFLPFHNADHFLSPDAATSVPFHWGAWGGLVYFAVFVAVVGGIALYTVNTRDA